MLIVKLECQKSTEAAKGAFAGIKQNRATVRMGRSVIVVFSERAAAMQVSSSVSMSASYASVSFSATRVSASQQASQQVSQAAPEVADEKPKSDVSIDVGNQRKRGHGGGHAYAHGHERGHRARGYGGGLAGNLIRKMDENRDGGASLSEVQNSRFGNRISEEKFAKIDSDGDGQMTAKELRSHFRQSLFGENGSGSVDESPEVSDPAETGSAGSVAQIASQQALATVTSVSVSVSVASASYSSTSGSFGGTVGDAEVPQEPMVGEAPTELAPVGDDKPSAAMEELAKIKAEAAVEAEEVDDDGDDVEIEDLGDLMEMMASGALDEMDPMKLIEEIAELMGVEFEAEDDGEEGMNIGSLGGEVDASFAASEVSLEAFSFEASLTTATFADGSSATSMSVNFTAISAYARTMEFSAAA